MTIPRALLALAGLTAAGYGVVRHLALGVTNLGASVEWLVGGVLLHDAEVEALVNGGGLLNARWAPARLRAPATVALVVLVPVTLVGLPELGRFGADPRNATLLDRHYWMGWLALVTLVVVMVAAGAVWGSVRGRHGRRRSRWHA
jgi:hypothetical protein